MDCKFVAGQRVMCVKKFAMQVKWNDIPFIEVGDVLVIRTIACALDCVYLTFEGHPLNHGYLHTHFHPIEPFERELEIMRAAALDAKGARRVRIPLTEKAQ